MQIREKLILTQQHVVSNLFWPNLYAKAQLKSQRLSSSKSLLSLASTKAQLIDIQIALFVRLYTLDIAYQSVSGQSSVIRQACRP